MGAMSVKVVIMARCDGCGATANGISTSTDPEYDTRGLDPVVIPATTELENVAFVLRQRCRCTKTETAE